MPTETALATSATDKMCKYDYAWTSTTTSTTKLKTAYTGKTTFTVSGFQSSQTAYGRHVLVHKATSLAGNTILTWTMNVYVSDSKQCESATYYTLT